MAHSQGCPRHWARACMRPKPRSPTIPTSRSLLATSTCTETPGLGSQGLGQSHRSSFHPLLARVQTQVSGLRRPWTWSWVDRCGAGLQAGTGGDTFTLSPRPGCGPGLPGGSWRCKTRPVNQRGLCIPARCGRAADQPRGAGRGADEERTTRCHGHPGAKEPGEEQSSQ